MKLHIASPESCMNNQAVLAESQNYDNYLLSYYYLSKVKEEKSTQFLTRFTNKNVIIDSGAHTFHNSKSKIDFKKYTEEYISWLLNNKFWDHYVELDIENIIGLSEVEKIRRKLENNLPKNPIVVWHKERGWDYWIKMCENYDYVGFSGFTMGNQKEMEVPEKLIPKFLEVAKENCCKVHGFGFTRCSLLKKYNFDSVDSSSWTYSSKMNENFIFDGSKIKYRGKFVKKPENVHLHGFRQWCNYGKYIEKWWENHVSLLDYLQ